MKELHVNPIVGYGWWRLQITKEGDRYLLSLACREGGDYILRILVSGEQVEALFEMIPPGEKQRLRMVLMPAAEFIDADGVEQKRLPR